MKGIFIILLSFQFTAAFADHVHQHHHSVHENLDKVPDQLNAESIYNGSSEWIDMNGKKQTLSHFKGRPQVVAMAFTSCQYACPIITANMKSIEKKLSPRLKNKVGFILFSFDSERDTPEALKKYFETKDLTGNWELLTSNKDAVREMAAILGVQYKQNKNKDFSHSNIIFVLDKEGVIKHRQIGLNQDPQETVKVLENLLEKK